MRRKLRDYQKEMLKYTLSVQHPALFVQMRLGKTIVAIRSIKLRFASKILVVAPYSALYGWNEELYMENQAEKGIIELFGKRQERLDSLDLNYDSSRWFLVNKEGHRVIPEMADYHWNAVIMDESHFIKGPKSGVSRFWIDNFRGADYRYILSGTPAPESELDYYNQIRFLSHRYWRENNFWKFRHRNFGIIEHHAYVSPKGSKYITKNLARRCFFLSRHDVNLGGKKIYEKRYVKMTDKVRSIYRRVEKEFVLEYLGLEQETIYAPTKYIWLRRLCGGFADTEFVSYAKMKELKALLEGELNGEQTVIVCRHTNEVVKVSKWLSKWWKIGTIYGAVKKVSRPAIIKDFNDGKINHIVAQPTTIEEGVNLSKSDTIIFYTTPDGGKTRMQVEDRIVDTSKNDSSLIIDLVCRNTIEEDVLRSLKRKETRQTTMKRMVQRLQRKYNLGDKKNVR